MRYFLFNNYKQNTTSLSLLVGTIVDENRCKQTQASLH